jgi:hypothetical protein
MESGADGKGLTAAQSPRLTDLARRLAADGLALARAELVLARVRLSPEITRAAIATALLAAACVLGLLGGIALVVGLVIILLRPLGAGVAGLVVGGPAILIAGLLGWSGIRGLLAQLKRLRERLP